jgi:hypothetical protein
VNQKESDSDLEDFARQLFLCSVHALTLLFIDLCFYYTVLTYSLPFAKPNVLSDFLCLPVVDAAPISSSPNSFLFNPAEESSSVDAHSTSTTEGNNKYFKLKAHSVPPFLGYARFVVFDKAGNPTFDANRNILTSYETFSLENYTKKPQTMTNVGLNLVSDGEILFGYYKDDDVLALFKEIRKPGID